MADYDIVIKRGAIIDGTRIRRYRGDIAVKDGRIVKIGKTSPTVASRALAADGLMVAPGFVDLQTQLDATYVKFRQAGRSIRPCRQTLAAGESRGGISPPARPDIHSLAAGLAANSAGR